MLWADGLHYMGAALYEGWAFGDRYDMLSAERMRHRVDDEVMPPVLRLTAELVFRQEAGNG